MMEELSLGRRMLSYSLERSRLSANESDRATGVLRLDRIPVDSIEPDPQNHRLDLGHLETDSPGTRAAFLELVASIRQEGLRDPVKVLPPEPPSQSYRIRDGHRRFFACIQAGLTEIDVLVQYCEDPKLRVEQLISNLMQERPNAYEIAVGIQHAIDAGMTAEQVASSLGKTASWVSNYRAILRYPESLQNALRDGRLRNINQARTLSRLSSEELEEALTRLDTADRALPSSKPKDGSEPEAPTRKKKAKPIEVMPARAELLLRHLLRVDPDLLRSAGFDPGQELPDRSRRAVAFRKLFEAVLEQLEPKGQA